MNRNNDSIRRLQRISALLSAIQYAADNGVDFDAGDALAVIVDLVGEAISLLDREAP